MNVHRSFPTVLFEQLQRDLHLHFAIPVAGVSGFLLLQTS